MNVDPDRPYEDLPEEQQAIVQWWVRLDLPIEVRGPHGVWIDRHPDAPHPRPGLHYRLKP